MLQLLQLIELALQGLAFRGFGAHSHARRVSWCLVGWKWSLNFQVAQHRGSLLRSSATSLTSGFRAFDNSIVMIIQAVIETLSNPEKDVTHPLDLGFAALQTSLVGKAADPEP